MPRIYVLSGPDLGRTFDVADGATFGRAAECAVPLRDVSVSRAHARLERDGAGWRVVDTGSRNGLHVGRERVSEARLADGDEFRLGEVLLRFRAEVAPPDVAALGGAPAAVAPVDLEAAEFEVEEAAGPALAFTRRGAARDEPALAAELESAEIELEGDWLAPAAPPSGAPARGPSAGSAPSTVPSTAPVAAPRSAAHDERLRKLAAAGIAPAAAGRAGERGVLQFHRVEHDERLLRQGFAEQPAWIRAAVVVLAIGLCAGLAWFGYATATAAKSRVAPSADAPGEPAADGPR